MHVELDPVKFFCCYWKMLFARRARPVAQPEALSKRRCTGAKDESSICINFNRFLFNRIRRSTVVELCNWMESVGSFVISEF